jgi:hypothetical protein
MISYLDIYLRPINLWSLHKPEKTSEKLRGIPLAQPVGWGGGTYPTLATAYPQMNSQDMHNVIHMVIHSVMNRLLTGYAQLLESC